MVMATVVSLSHSFICICSSQKFIAIHGDLVCCDTGVGGYDGDGDITKTDNLLELQEYVMDQTEGVHFVMADGVSPV